MYYWASISLQALAVKLLIIKYIILLTQSGIVIYIACKSKFVIYTESKLKHLSSIPTSVNLADEERRDIMMISDTFDNLVELAGKIEATPETECYLEQIKSSMGDLKHVLNRRRNNRVYDLMDNSVRVDS